MYKTIIDRPLTLVLTTLLVAYICLPMAKLRAIPPGGNIGDITNDPVGGVIEDEQQPGNGDDIEPKPWPSMNKWAVIIQYPFKEEICGSARTSDGEIASVGTIYDPASGDRDVYIVKIDDHAKVKLAVALGGDGSDEGLSITGTQDGGFVVVGCTSSFGGPQDNLLLAKFDAQDSLLWTKVMKRDYMPGSGILEFHGLSIIEDDDQNLVVTGYMHRGIPDRNSLLFAKFDSEGDLLDVRTVYNLAHAYWDHYGNSIVQTCDGGYLAAGWVHDASIGTDMLFVRFYPSGLLKWGWWISEPGSGNDERGYSIVRTADCGFAITGYSGNDMVVLLRSAEFDEVWQYISDEGSSVGNSVIETVDRGIVVDGEYSEGSGNLLLAKWMPTGVLEWSKSYGDEDEVDIGNSLIELGSKSLVSAGYTSGWSAQSKDAFMVRHDSNGTTCLTDCTGPSSFSHWNPVEGTYAFAEWSPQNVVVIDWLIPTLTPLYVTVDTLCPSFQNVVDNTNRPTDASPVRALGSDDQNINNDGKESGTELISKTNDEVVRSKFSLNNFPNPFNPTTEICFSIPEACRVRLGVYNLLGQQIDVLVDNYLQAGEHTVSWNGCHAASGLYFYRIEAGSFMEIKKMVLVK